jgi:hypothetical protein
MPKLSSLKHNAHTAFNLILCFILASCCTYCSIQIYNKAARRREHNLKTYWAFNLLLLTEQLYFLVCVVSIMCNVSLIVCVALCVVLFCVICVFLCVVSYCVITSTGKGPFAVQLNNNKISCIKGPFVFQQRWHVSVHLYLRHTRIVREHVISWTFLVCLKQKPCNIY